MSILHGKYLYQIANNKISNSKKKFKLQLHHSIGNVPRATKVYRKTQEQKNINPIFIVNTHTYSSSLKQFAAVPFSCCCCCPFYVRT